MLALEGRMTMTLLVKKMLLLTTMRFQPTTQEGLSMMTTKTTKTTTMLMLRTMVMEMLDAQVGAWW